VADPRGAGRGAGSVERQAREALAGEGLSASSWGNGPGDRYGEHRHGYDKVLVAAAGSITFLLPEQGRDVELQIGDRLELPAGTLHGALVGTHGVTCLEAHLPSGSLPALRHLPRWAGGGGGD
jgi:quercetin dioxygenase-like cupin family protein